VIAGIDATEGGMVTETRDGVDGRSRAGAEGGGVGRSAGMVLASLARS